MAEDELEHESSGTRSCSRGECPKFFPDHRWGAMAADREGWFMQRNGKAWCPDHNPDWVAEWRASKKQQEE